MNTPARREVTDESLESRTAPASVAAPTPAPTLPENTAAEAELAKVRNDQAAAEARSKTLEEQLTRVAAELEGLRSENETTNVSRAELEKKLKEAEQVANAINDNLLEIRQARSKDSLTIGAQDLQIQKLSEKLAEQAEMLEVFTALNQKISVCRRKHAALSALFRTLLHDLMTARIRVHDVDLPELETVATK